MAVLLVGAGGAALDNGGGGLLATTSPVIYIGPLDLVAGAVVAYSQRAMSSALRGTAVYTIRRDSDDATQAFSSDATTGAVDAAAITAFIGSAQHLTEATIDAGGSGYDDGITPSTFDVTLVGGTGTASVVNVSTDGTGVVTAVNSITTAGQYIAAPPSPCATSGDDGTNHGTGLTVACTFADAVGSVRIWNDQSGGANSLEQTTLDNQPNWSALQYGGVPGLTFTGNMVFSATAETIPLSASGLTLFVVLQFTASDDPGILLLTADSKHPLTISTDWNGPGDIYVQQKDIDGGNESDWVTAGPMTDAVHILEVVIDAAGAVAVLVDGVDAGATLQYGSQQALAATSVSYLFPSNMPDNNGCAEGAVWNSALSAPDRLAIRENVADYYGITLA